MDILQPPAWKKSHGYSNGVIANGRFVFIRGQIGWDAQQQFQSTDFVEQARQALRNILEVLSECGGSPQHIMRLTWYVVDRHEYLVSYKDLGKVYRELMGNHYPAMTAVVVAALLEDQAKLEIEATAVIP